MQPDVSWVSGSLIHFIPVLMGTHLISAPKRVPHFQVDHFHNWTITTLTTVLTTKRTSDCTDVHELCICSIANIPSRLISILSSQHLVMFENLTLQCQSGILLRLSSKFSRANATLYFHNLTAYTFDYLLVYTDYIFISPREFGTHMDISKLTTLVTKTMGQIVFLHNESGQVYVKAPTSFQLLRPIISFINCGIHGN